MNLKHGKLMLIWGIHGLLLPQDHMSFIASLHHFLRLLCFLLMSLKHIFYPFNNGFHQLHHFFPAVPLANLRKMDTLLRECSSTYRKCEVYDGYFFGKNSIINSIFSAVSETHKNVAHATV